MPAARASGKRFDERAADVLKQICLSLSLKGFRPIIASPVGAQPLAFKTIFRRDGRTHW